MFIFTAFIIFSPYFRSYSSEKDISDAAKKILRSYTRTSSVEKAATYLKEAKDAGVDAETLESAAKSRYKRRLDELKESYSDLESPVKPFLSMTPQSVFMKELKEWNGSAKDTIAYIF